MGTQRFLWRAGELTEAPVVVRAPDAHARTVERIEDLLAMYGMPGEMVVWRALASLDGLSPGRVLHEPLYLSATLLFEQVEALGIPVQIHVPEGTPVVPLGWLTSEALPGEVLLGRGGRLRIDSVCARRVRATLLGGVWQA